MKERGGERKRGEDREEKARNWRGKRGEDGREKVEE